MTFTKEKVQWLHDAATEFASTGMKMTMRPDEILQLTNPLLAMLTAEPVAYIGERMLEDLTDGARSCGRVWPVVKDKLSGEGRIPLYAAPSAPVVPEAYVRDERGRMMLNGVCEPRIGFGFGWNACRAAMLQGKSERVDEIAEQAGADPRWVDAYQQGYNDSEARKPAIPDGWKLVPVVAFPSQWAAGQKAFESAGINKVDDIYKAMVAAAPQQEAESE